MFLGELLLKITAALHFVLLLLSIAWHRDTTCLPVLILENQIPVLVSINRSLLFYWTLKILLSIKRRLCVAQSLLHRYCIIHPEKNPFWDYCSRVLVLSQRHLLILSFSICFLLLFSGVIFFKNVFCNFIEFPDLFFQFKYFRKNYHSKNST